MKDQAVLIEWCAEAMRIAGAAGVAICTDLITDGFTEEQVHDVSDNIYGMVVTLTLGLELNAALHSVSDAFDPDLMDSLINAEVGS